MESHHLQGPLRVPAAVESSDLFGVGDAAWILIKGIVARVSSNGIAR